MQLEKASIAGSIFLTRGHDAEASTSWSGARAQRHDDGDDLPPSSHRPKALLPITQRDALTFDEIVGQSTALRGVLHEVEMVAPTESTVLVCGETGTGKELIARAIHQRSARAGSSLVTMNCAAVPGGLLESELFGHEKGAFTGAIMRRTGRFELAQDGTLFLDEIGELPQELQPKLLRLLQEREFERLGGNRTLRVNARLIAATNRDLAEMVEARSFREDLYYRLSVFPIHVPALRERKDDIPLLAEAFMRRFARRMGKSIEAISPAAMAELLEYDWPGNIRELMNVIERAVILTSERELVPSLGVRRSARKALELAAPMPAAEPARDTLDAVQRAHILSVLHATNWVVAGPQGAAARLGLKRSTLNFRMKRLGIARPGTRAALVESTSQDLGT
jgi:formate hydrogenlyase transcriptional activator